MANKKTKQNEQVVQAVAGVSLESVAAKLATTSVEIQKSLASVSAKMTEQLQTLGTLEQAIDLKREELKTLHNIETTAVTLIDLEEAVEQARSQAEEQKQQILKDRAREQDEYNYTLKLQQRKRTEDYEAELGRLAKIHADKLAALDKQFAEREAKLKAAEGELSELRTERDAYEAELLAEVKKAEDRVTKEKDRQFAHDKALWEKDKVLAEADLKNKVSGLIAANDSLRLENERLRNEAQKAHDAVSAISQKAMEASSGRSALEALQRSIETQPTNYGKGK